MANKTKLMKKKPAVKQRAIARSRSSRAGLEFPVGRVQRYLRKGEYAKHISSTSAVFLAAVLEYLTAELVESAGQVTRETKRSRITPRHIVLSLGGDDEFAELFRKNKVIIPEAGVIPHIEYVLLPKKTNSKMPRVEKETSEESGNNETTAQIGTECENEITADEENM